LEHWCFEFVSNFGLPRRDLMGTLWCFIPAPVPVLVTQSCTPDLGRGFRDSNLVAAKGMHRDKKRNESAGA
jgi:hypothetical protein